MIVEIDKRRSESSGVSGRSSATGASTPTERFWSATGIENNPLMCRELHGLHLVLTLCLADNSSALSAMPMIAPLF